MITESLAKEYVLEYKRFLVMAACSQFMVSPSEQVDHVWHLHQLCTVEYRNFCNQVFGTYYKHQPSGGGQEEGTKFKGIYNQTLEYYKALFGRDAPASIWEQTDERFSPDIFNCSMVNIQRLANYTICEMRQPHSQFYYMNTLKRKNLQAYVVSGYSTVYDRKYSTDRRKDFV